ESVLVTAMKSPPRKTRATPGSSNSALANGLRAALSVEAKSAVEKPITSRPGKNFRVAGFGVPSVSMNMTEACPCSALTSNRTAPVRSKTVTSVHTECLARGRGAEKAGRSVRGDRNATQARGFGVGTDGGGELFEDGARDAVGAPIGFRVPLEADGKARGGARLAGDDPNRFDRTVRGH